MSNHPKDCLSCNRNQGCELQELVTGEELPFEGLHVTPIVGLEQVKTASLTIEKTLPAYEHLKGVTVNIAVTSGLEGIMS